MKLDPYMDDTKEQIDLMEKKLGANFAQQIALIDYKNKPLN